MDFALCAAQTNQNSLRDIPTDFEVTGSYTSRKQPEVNAVIITYEKLNLNGSTSFKILVNDYYITLLPLCFLANLLMAISEDLVTGGYRVRHRRETGRCLPIS